MTPRYWALGIGIVYLLVGVVGFVPALYTSPPATPHLDVTASYGMLLGLFPVNALHDAVHILIGLLGIAAFASLRTSRSYARSLFFAYGVLTVMGFLPTLNTVFGLIPIFGNDTWLHAGTAIVSSYFGWVAGESTSEPAVHPA